MDVLATHNQLMFDSLLYEHNITSDTLKEIDFDTAEPIRGFFAVKDRKKYWIDENIFVHLPIKAGQEFEELKQPNNDDVIFRPLKPVPFKIIPQQMFEIRKLIDDFVPFSHTNPQHWMLMKFISLMGYIGRTYCCVASNSEFGKSSIYDVLHYLTDKSPVFKPRSVPGVLNQINGTGNIIFDETHRCKKEVRDIIEEFALQIGGGKALYINGAMKCQRTKTKYNCVMQSITFLYNNVENYQDPKSDYFEFIFSNNKAIDSRFLKIKLDGKLQEKFDKDFDINAIAISNKVFYINFAKTLLYLQELKKSNGYTRRYITKYGGQLKGRRRMVFDEITWLIDMYCLTQDEYDNYVNGLDNAILDYQGMVNKLNTGDADVVVEDVE